MTLLDILLRWFKPLSEVVHRDGMDNSVSEIKLSYRGYQRSRRDSAHLTARVQRLRVFRIAQRCKYVSKTRDRSEAKRKLLWY